MGAKIDRIRDSLVTKEGQEVFVKWMADPMTQMILSAAREYARPARRYSAEATDIIHANGESIGANAVLDFIESPWRTGRGAGEELPGAQPPALKPSYGAESLLTKEADDA